MKRTTSILLIALLLIFLFAGCSASTAAYDSTGSTSFANTKSMAVAEEAIETEANASPFAEETIEAESDTSSLTSTSSSNASNYGKIIYTGNATLETLSFDEATDAIPALAESLGGYVSYSNITGLYYYNDYQNLRSANFTLRIPSEHFSGLQDALSEIGNVTLFEIQTKDITSQYYDTESRLTSYRTEESRLLELLEQCESVEDIITVRSELSDVQYQIDSLTSTIKSYDDQIAYSTIDIYLEEVSSLSDPEPAVQSYGERLVSGFVGSLKSIGLFFQDLFVGIVAALPYLVLIAIVGAVVLTVILVHRRHKKHKSIQKPEPNDK